MRLKEKNEERINEMMKTKAITVSFNSNVGEIKPKGVVIVRDDGTKSEIPNDYVFIFAGGELPTELLKKAGVRLRGTEVEAKAA